MPTDDQMTARRHLRASLIAALIEADVAGLTDAGIWIDRAIVSLGMPADDAFERIVTTKHEERGAPGLVATADTGYAAPAIAGVFFKTVASPD